VKGIVQEDSSCNVSGLIKIENNAEKSDSYLSNKILKFDKATAESFPCLEIKTNDVKASHESSITKIDEDQLFYMMSRGISKEEVKNLIIEGFFDPIINNIKIKEKFEKTKVV